jgi:hypothetical protein
MIWPHPHRDVNHSTILVHPPLLLHLREYSELLIFLPCALEERNRTGNVDFEINAKWQHLLATALCVNATPVSAVSSRGIRVQRERPFDVLFACRI